MQVPIKFYDDFYDEFETLPREAQDSLLSYLECLQQNPDSSELRTENNGPDHFAYTFHSQYVIYCHLQREPSPFTGLLGQIARIEVLSIEGVDEVLHKTGFYDGLVKRVIGRFGF